MIRDIEGNGPGTQREMMTRDGDCFRSVSSKSLLPDHGTQSFGIGDGKDDGTLSYDDCKTTCAKEKVEKWLEATSA